MGRRALRLDAGTVKRWSMGAAGLVATVGLAAAVVATAQAPADPPASGAAVVATGVVQTDAPLPADDISLDCRDYATGDSGAYRYENNAWGKAGVSGPWLQCIGIGPVAADGSVSARWRWAWPPGPNEVKGYPALAYGQKPGFAATTGSNLPRRVDDIGVAVAQWRTRSRTTGTGQLAFDLWLTRDATRHARFDSTPITHEIMIALESYGGYGLDRNPAWLLGSVTVDGEPYRLYKADDFGITKWRFIVLQSLRARPEGQVDLRAVLTMLKERGLIEGTEYLSSVEFGSEPETGTGEVVVQALRIEVR